MGRISLDDEKLNSSDEQWERLSKALSAGADPSNGGALDIESLDGQIKLREKKLVFPPDRDSSDHDSEMGNLLFGNSRGKFPIVNREKWQWAIGMLLKHVGGGEESFENDEFKVSPYYWGDCDCGAEEKVLVDKNAGIDINSDEYGLEHTERCSLVVPNFLHKPTGFEIQWYKRPLRDAYMSQKLAFEAFLEMLNRCLKSIERPELDWQAILPPTRDKPEPSILDFHK